MRKLVFPLFLLAVLFIACGPSQMKEDREAILMGKSWQFDHEAILAGVNFSKLTPQQGNIARATMANLANAIFTFQADSLLLIDMPNGNQLTGGWAISEDGQERLLQMTAMSTNFQTISTFTEDRIELAADVDKGFVYSKIFVPAKKSARGSNNSSSSTTTPDSTATPAQQ